MPARRILLMDDTPATRSSEDAESETPGLDESSASASERTLPDERELRMLRLLGLAVFLEVTAAALVAARWVQPGAGGASGLVQFSGLMLGIAFIGTPLALIALLDAVYLKRDRAIAVAIVAAAMPPTVMVIGHLAG